VARSLVQFLRDVAKKPPVMMPFIAAAHLFWLLWTIWMLWLQVGWMLGYTIFWIAACDLRRWGAIGYILLTVLNTSIFLGVKSIYTRDIYTSNLFILDALFSFYLVFFYRRITRKTA
jgi:hypothetical protein